MGESCCVFYDWDSSSKFNVYMEISVHSKPLDAFLCREMTISLSIFVDFSTARFFKNTKTVDRHVELSVTFFLAENILAIMSCQLNNLRTISTIKSFSNVNQTLADLSKSSPDFTISPITPIFIPGLAILGVIQSAETVHPCCFFSLVYYVQIDLNYLTDLYYFNNLTSNLRFLMNCRLSVVAPSTDPFLLRKALHCKEAFLLNFQSWHRLWKTLQRKIQ